MKALHHFYLILTIALFITSSAIAQKNSWENGVVGKGPMVEKTLDLASFNAVKLSVSADVILTQGSSQSVKVKGQQNIVDLLETEVKEKGWRIKFSKNVKKHEGLTVYITLPELTKLKVSGSGNAKTTNQFSTNSDFQVAVSGSGDIEADIKAKEIKGAISGSGDIELKGSTDKLAISISGSGDFDASALSSNSCAVKISGSGDCSVDVSQELNVSIAGSGDVSYKGNPSVKSKIVGSGDVEKRG